MSGRGNGRFPYTRWLTLFLMLGLPVAGVVWLAYLLDALMLAAACGLLAALLAIVALFAAWHTNAAWQVLRRTEEIVGQDAQAPQKWHALTMLGELGATVERMAPDSPG